jgi:hypothetical protein
MEIKTLSGTTVSSCGEGSYGSVHSVRAQRPCGAFARYSRRNASLDSVLDSPEVSALERRGEMKHHKHKPGGGRDRRVHVTL